ncbi:MAG: hypothetical protein V3V08_09445, partial [Nannocystaceae bacterium]
MSVLSGLLLLAGSEVACGEGAIMEDSLDTVRDFVRSGLGLEGLAPANEGAWEGGPNGSPGDAALTNVLADAADRRGDGVAVYNIPTNGPPSPVYGAQSFSQQMLRFEEFGPKNLGNPNNGNGGTTLPVPPDAGSAPDSAALDHFLKKKIRPYPARLANTARANPWAAQIEASIGRPLDSPPAEGRPPGEDWAHQRWQEFFPEVYVKTAQTGARPNRGLRDGYQDHGYQDGEFGSGGLYHNTAGVAGMEGTTDGIDVRFHPSFPEQDHTALWTFDGTFPPKLLKTRYGEPVLFRHYNALPVDLTANRGFGLHTITTHEHNGHHPAESDGFANAFFFPGQFYDYHWPMVLAGHDTINTAGSDLRAGAPDGNGGITAVPGDWRETMSTHWFHDHMLDFTAQNVYKGNVAMTNFYSSVDRGNEALEDGINLRLPSGTAADWGNRDYDVNLLLADKAWDQDGQLWFNPFNVNGFLGDKLLTNWLYHPYFDVRARRYRFRILNGSVSRYIKLALVDETGTPVPFHLVANDGNLMEHTVYFANGVLPTQGIAERYDIVVDFAGFSPGDKLYFVNVLAHKDGQVTDGVVPIADILSGAYNPVAVDTDNDGSPDEWQGGDPAVGKFMEFRVAQYNGTDLSMDPGDYVDGGDTMIPLRRPTSAQIANARHRNFEFEKNPTDDAPWVIETDGG